MCWVGKVSETISHNLEGREREREEVSTEVTARCAVVGVCACVHTQDCGLVFYL